MHEADPRDQATGERARTGADQSSRFSPKGRLTNKWRVLIAGLALAASLGLLVYLRHDITFPEDLATQPKTLLFLFAAWVVGPPLWFLFDWWQFESNDKQAIENFKYSVELASKVWLAVSVLIGVLLIGAKP